MFLCNCSSGGPGGRYQPRVHPSLADIQTLVRLAAWQKGLADHPDQRFAKYVLQGLREGFRVGFQYQTSGLQQSHRNMLIIQPLEVRIYISNQLEAERLAVISPEEEIASCSNPLQPDWNYYKKLNLESGA